MTQAPEPVAMHVIWSHEISLLMLGNITCTCIRISAGGACHQNYLVLYLHSQWGAWVPLAALGLVDIHTTASSTTPLAISNQYLLQKCLEDILVLNKFNFLFTLLTMHFLFLKALFQLPSIFVLFFFTRLSFLMKVCYRLEMIIFHGLYLSSLARSSFAFLIHTHSERLP